VKNYYKTFDAYVADFPDGEMWRKAYVSRKRRDQVFMVRGSCWHGGLPGGFFFMISSDSNDDGPMILAEDNDDGILFRLFENTWDRDYVFQHLRSEAPFGFDDLIKNYQFAQFS